ncbi:hypothetical protein ACFE04_019778 [Oxalis oulophora]
MFYAQYLRHQQALYYMENEEIANELDDLPGVSVAALSLAAALVSGLGSFLLLFSFWARKKKEFLHRRKRHSNQLFSYLVLMAYAFGEIEALLTAAGDLFAISAASPVGALGL